jgi:hypothetical protein
MRASRTGSRLACLALTIALVTSAAVSAASAAQTSTTPKPAAPEPPGLGIGSAAALAQKTCNPNGRTSINVVATGPFCVNPWPAGKDNGGATAPGITATSVKVVVYAPNQEMFAASATELPPMNLATGGRGQVEDAVKDWQSLYDYMVEHLGAYQLWGRHPDIEVVTASGPDEASQNADAVEVIAKKPFIVFDMTRGGSGGAPVFSAALAAHKIVVFSASTTSAVGAKQSPYRFSWNSDPESSTVLAAAFVGRSLAGRRAQWAGEDDLKSKTRAFGVIHPTTGFDMAQYQKYLKQNGGSAVGVDVSYDPTNTQQMAEQAQTIVSKLKASGVTSVVLFADFMLLGPLLKAATAQDYHPEWVFTGYQFQDFDGFPRSFDQDQMKHAFGIGTLLPSVKGGSPDLDLFTWYMGPNRGTTWATANGLFGYLYTAIQFAGPKLTAANVKKGLFARPVSQGAADGTIVFQDGFGKTPKMPYDEYAPLGSDRALIWWDPDITGPSNATGIQGKGLFMYLDDGKRYSYDSLPKTTPKYFDSKSSTFEAPVTSLYVGGVSPVITPCTGCPSQQGGG